MATIDVQSLLDSLGHPQNQNYGFGKLPDTTIQYNPTAFDLANASFQRRLLQQNEQSQASQNLSIPEMIEPGLSNQLPSNQSSTNPKKVNRWGVEWSANNPLLQKGPQQEGGLTKPSARWWAEAQAWEQQNANNEAKYVTLTPEMVNQMNPVYRQFFTPGQQVPLSALPAYINAGTKADTGAAKDQRQTMIQDSINKAGDEFLSRIPDNNQDGTPNLQKAALAMNIRAAAAQGDLSKFKDVVLGYVPTDKAIAQTGQANAAKGLSEARKNQVETLTPLQADKLVKQTITESYRPALIQAQTTNMNARTQKTLNSGNGKGTGAKEIKSAQDAAFQDVKGLINYNKTPADFLQDVQNPEYASMLKGRMGNLNYSKLLAYARSAVSKYTNSESTGTGALFKPGMESPIHAYLVGRQPGQNQPAPQRTAGTKQNGTKSESLMIGVKKVPSLQAAQLRILLSQGDVNAARKMITKMGLDPQKDWQSVRQWYLKGK